MKTEIIVVAGFLDSGKTTYIEETINIGDIVITEEKNKKSVKGEIYVDEINFDVLKKYRPEKGRIFLELNGSRTHDDLFTIFESKEFRKEYVVERSVFIINSENFEHIKGYFPEIYSREIYYFNEVYIRDGANAKNIFKALIRSGLDSNIMLIKRDSLVSSRRKDILYAMALVLFAAFYLIYLRLPYEIKSNSIVPKVILNITSLMMEALPFFLLGNFISSLIRHINFGQGFFRASKYKIVSYLKGLFAGFFLPVCDCAGIPVSLAFYSKGAGDVFSLTFMLAAPILNPIVIFSTYSAFGSWKMVLLRAVGGIIAISIGVFIWNLLGLKLRKESTYGIGHTPEIYFEKDKSFFNRLKSIVKMTEVEFMNSVIYLVIGICISSVLKETLPIDQLSGVKGLVISVVLAYMFSLCSSSDAFVGALLFKSMVPLLGFIIAGPMMDLKNSLVFSKSQGVKRTILLILIMMLSTVLSVLLLERFMV